MFAGPTIIGCVYAHRTHTTVAARPLLPTHAGTVWQEPRCGDCMTVAVHSRCTLSATAGVAAVSIHARTAVARGVHQRWALSAGGVEPLVPAGAVAPVDDGPCDGRRVTAAVQSNRALCNTARVVQVSCSTSSAVLRSIEVCWTHSTLWTTPLIATSAVAQRLCVPRHRDGVTAAVCCRRATQVAVGVDTERGIGIGAGTTISTRVVSHGA